MVNISTLRQYYKTKYNIFIPAIYNIDGRSHEEFVLTVIKHFIRSFENF